jgi:RND family efflux transporter MFP subunit
MMKREIKNILLFIGIGVAGFTACNASAATTVGAMQNIAANTSTPNGTAKANATPADDIISDITGNSDQQLDTKTPEYVILQPIEEATFSSETSASVAKLFVKEGSYFRSGDILLELDCRVQKAEYEKAIAQQVATNIALKSAQKLKGYGSISEFEVVKAQSEAAMVNADVNKLSAIVEKCVIKAPYNGAVAELQVHTHESVKPGDPLIKIVNTDHLIVELEVPSSWLQWLHINSSFMVHVNELNKSIGAKIVRINPKIEPVSQTVKVVGEIAASSDKLLPGMSGQAIFPENANKKSVTSTVNKTSVPTTGSK